MQYVVPFYGIDISTVSWKDSKLLNMALPLTGIKPYKYNVGATPVHSPAVERFKKRKYMVGVDLTSMVSSLGGRHIIL